MTKVMYFFCIKIFGEKKETLGHFFFRRIFFFFWLALNDQISHKNEKKRMIIFKSRIKFKNFKLFKEAN